MKPCQACCAHGHPSKCIFDDISDDDLRPISQADEIRNLRAEIKELRRRIESQGSYTHSPKRGLCVTQVAGNTQNARFWGQPVLTQPVNRVYHDASETHMAQAIDHGMYGGSSSWRRCTTRSELRRCMSSTISLPTSDHRAYYPPLREGLVQRLRRMVFQVRRTTGLSELSFSWPDVLHPLPC